ncbi:membrane protein [Clostridia bacterium]|nr:membrane protein [Clostridia bacterium]
MAAITASKKKVDLAFLWLRLQKWTYTNRWYFFAFFLPVAIVYVAFAKFGMYPFGDQCVLVLDLAGQYVSYFEYMHDAFRGDGSLFYSWSRDLSGEFFGTIGYYLASPFNIIVWILPRTMILGAMYLAILLKVGVAAVTFLHFLRNTTKINFLNGIIFSSCYALMAYMIVQTMDPMWLDGLVFLPLIILGIRRLVDNDLKVGYIVPLAIMLIANFYIGMQICIFSALYFIYYVIFGTNRFEGKWNQKQLKSNSINFGLVCVRFAVCSILAACLAAFLLLPVYNALKLGKFDFSTPDYTFKAQFKMLDFLPRLLPNSYDTCRPEGMMDIYAGSIAVLMLPLFFLNSKISARVKIGQTFLIAVMLFSMYIKPLDMYWHGGQSPNWLPYRYSFIFSFIILTIAAHAFSELEGFSLKAIGGSVAGIVGLLFILETRDFASQINYEKMGFDVFKILWTSALLIAIYAVLLGLLKKYPKSYVLSVVFLAIVSGELYTNTFGTFNAIQKDVAYTKRHTYYSLINNTRDVVDKIEADDSSLWRGDKTFQRTINDPMAVGLRGISHSTSVMNNDILILLEKLGYMSNGYRSIYKGSTPITDSLLGFKYILNRDVETRNPGIGFVVDPTYQRLDKYTTAYHNTDFDNSTSLDKKGDPLSPNPENNDAIAVYQNPNALAVGYMVNSDILKIAKFDGFNVFWNQNTLLSTLVGKAQSVGTSAPVPVDYFKRLSLDEEPVLNNVTFNPSYNHYDKAGPESADHTVEYHLTVPTNDPVYLYCPTGDKQPVNVWLSTNKTADGNFVTPFDKVGEQYLTDENYCVLKLGQFAPGTQIAVRFTVVKTYAQIDEALFYYLDMATFQQDINLLKENQWNIRKWSSSHIEGNIIAKQNQVMLTSIPYEEGWSIKVDGVKTEPVKVLSGLIGIPMSAGEHEVTMTFRPNGFHIGVLLGIIALAACVWFIYYDRKHNAVYITKIEKKKEYIKSLRTPKKTAIKNALKKSENSFAKLKAEIEQKEKDE